MCVDAKCNNQTLSYENELEVMVRSCILTDVYFSTLYTESVTTSDTDILLDVKISRVWSKVKLQHLARDDRIVPLYRV